MTYKRTLSVKTRFNKATRNAGMRGISWDIPLEKYESLLVGHCAYCQGPLNKEGCGLDRKDNSRGYSIDNVVSCCGNCNRVKGPHLTYDEMCVAMDAILRLRRIQQFGAVVNA